MSKVLVIVVKNLRAIIQAIITLAKGLLDSVFNRPVKSSQESGTSPVEAPTAADDTSGFGSSTEGERRKEKESAEPELPHQSMVPPPLAPPPAPPPAAAPQPAPSTTPSTGAMPAVPPEPEPEASPTDEEAKESAKPNRLSDTASNDDDLAFAGSEPEPEAPPEPVLPPIVGEVEESDAPGGRIGDILEKMEEESDQEIAFEDVIGGATEAGSSTLTGGGEDYKPLEEVAKEAQQVEFMAYYPKEVVPEEWKPLTAYVYKAAFADVVTQDAKKQLGSELSEMREVGESARQPITEGALITATPYLTGFRFNPPSITVGFYEDWHRLDFKLQAKDTPLQQATNGYLTFTVEGIIVADIPLSVFVGATSAESETVNVKQKLYQSIFCSYSHDDTLIIERVERAYKALGLDYLRDVYTLKSGQDWDDQLLALIEQADIFQLFWSQTAADSPYVRQEWEYALKLDRDEMNFIRPVYWKQPLPLVPPELGHIHFAYQPDLDD